MVEVAEKGSEQVRAGIPVRRDGLLPPPVGTSDWARFSRTSYCVNADYWPLIAKRPHMLNAGVEVNEYAPVTFEELVENNAKFRAAAVREVARGVNG